MILEDARVGVEVEAPVERILEGAREAEAAALVEGAGREERGEERAGVGAGANARHGHGHGHGHVHGHGHAGPVEGGKTGAETGIAHETPAL